MNGERIRQARKSLGLTQAALADLSGIPLSTLKGYEGNERTPGADSLVKLCNVGININWLLTGSGPMLLAGDNQATRTNKETTADTRADIEQELRELLRPKITERDLAHIKAQLNEITELLQQRTQPRSAFSLRAVVNTLKNCFKKDNA